LDVPLPGLSPPPFEVYTQLEILHPTQLAGIFSPAVEIRDGPMLFVTLTGLGCAVLGCFDRSRLARLALTIVILSVLLALGQHTLVGRASWYVPVLNYVREPVRALFLYQFGMAVLAALGVRFITERFGTRRLAVVALAGLVSAGVIAEAVGARDWVILRTDSKLIVSTISRASSRPTSATCTRSVQSAVIAPR
jgi:hypothetical protein